MHKKIRIFSLLIIVSILFSCPAIAPEIKVLQNVGNLEGQAKIALVETGAEMVEDKDTYIDYDFRDELNLTFKPYEANFEIGDEFEKDLNEKRPGLESTYSLNNNLDLFNSIWIDGNFTVDDTEREPTEGDYWEGDTNNISNFEQTEVFSEKRIATRLGSEYKMSNFDITGTILLESDSNDVEDEWKFEVEEEDYDEEKGVYEEQEKNRRWALNLLVEDYTVTDSIVGKAEILLGQETEKGEFEQEINRDEETILSEFEKYDQAKETEFGLLGFLLFFC